MNYILRVNIEPNRNITFFLKVFLVASSRLVLFSGTVCIYSSRLSFIVSLDHYDIYSSVSLIHFYKRLAVLVKFTFVFSLI